MPAGDVIFQRLESATEGELTAMAKALREEKHFLEQRTRAEQADFLSRHLRADGGSAFRNIFRADHELPYFKVLEDVAIRAASTAHWVAPGLDPSMADEHIEDYILHAFASCAEPHTDAEKQALEKAAQMALMGKELKAPSFVSKLIPGVIGGAIANTALGLAVGAPLGVAIAATAIAGPAMRRTTPAVLVLIHVRNRIRAEALLGEDL